MLEKPTEIIDVKYPSIHTPNLTQTYRSTQKIVGPIGISLEKLEILTFL
jgi:hypothetical protein